MLDRMRRIATHPPLKAPTGFLTGGVTTTSCSRGLVVWKDLDRKGDGVLSEEASLGMKAREAMIGD
jgi:hypothetical protein